MTMTYPLIQPSHLRRRFPFSDLTQEDRLQMERRVAWERNTVMDILEDQHRKAEVNRFAANPVPVTP